MKSRVKVLSSWRNAETITGTEHRLRKPDRPHLMDWFSSLLLCFTWRAYFCFWGMLISLIVDDGHLMVFEILPTTVEIHDAWVMYVQGKEDKWSLRTKGPKWKATDHPVFREAKQITTVKILQSFPVHTEKNVMGWWVRVFISAGRSSSC